MNANIGLVAAFTHFQLQHAHMRVLLNGFALKYLFIQSSLFILSYYHRHIARTQIKNVYKWKYESKIYNTVRS